MSIYAPMFVIPVVVFGIVVWIFCCYLAKKQRRAGGLPLRHAMSPSVYGIPIFEQQQEEAIDVCEAYYQPLSRDPPRYNSISDCPPYWLETSSYQDPPPSYTPPPDYSEQP